MMTVPGLISLATQVPSSESYGELLRSGPHWLFELTLEALTAPLAFALGWLSRNHVLGHLRRDLQAIAGGVRREVAVPVGGSSARKVACVAIHGGRAVTRSTCRVPARELSSMARARRARRLKRATGSGLGDGHRTTHV